MLPNRIAARVPPKRPGSAGLNLEGKLTPTSVSNDDNIYLNMILTNNSSEVQKLEANVTYTAPITNDATTRYLAVTRFVLDGLTIPIFFFQDGQYIVTVDNKSETVVYDASYVNNGWYPDDQPIFSYQSFLDMINVALDDAWTAAGYVGYVSPKFAYNYADGIIGLAYPLAAYEDFAPNPPKIFMNNILYNFFGNWDAKLGPERDPLYAEILIRDGYVNRVTAEVNMMLTEFVVMRQEFQSLYNWFDITTITFISNQLKIRGEAVPTIQLGPGQLGNASAGIGTSKTNVLTDFQPAYTPGDQAGPRGYNYFAAQGLGGYRPIDILDDSIQAVDIQVYLQDRIGKQYIYYLPPRQTLYIKLALVRKELLKN